MKDNKEWRKMLIEANRDYFCGPDNKLLKVATEFAFLQNAGTATSREKEVAYMLHTAIMLKEILKSLEELKTIISQGQGRKE